MIRHIYVAGQGGRYHGKISYPDFLRLLDQSIRDDFFRDIRGGYSWDHKPSNITIRLYLTKKLLLPYLDHLGIRLYSMYSSRVESGIDTISTTVNPSKRVIYV